jgi:hypothetical protein
MEAEEELPVRIQNPFAGNRATRGVFERIHKSLIRRAEACIREAGDHFEYQLQQLIIIFIVPASPEFDSGQGARYGRNWTFDTSSGLYAMEGA